MAHDLEEINVAIALGDKVWPPIGSIMETCYGDRFEVVNWAKTPYIQGEYFGYAGKPTRPVWVALESIVKFLHVPGDTPPFHEWVRDDT